ncbi:hypothetical protein [Azohydromonas lata]|uniref:Lipoprotein n=1 Tax=Azohydromonas lata TaxID=45677 RepID=A0ABU5I881_9BURK|nr:hypothetical protein [Azohydromonas lata]MDZ5455299.1 hypothetical protein [Azohydromonas lata]
MALASVVTGCATSGQALQERKPLNVFVSPGTIKQTALTISEMSGYCSRNLYDMEYNEYPALKKITIDYKGKNRGDQHNYYRRIDIDETGINQSKVTIYNSMDIELNRIAASQIEKWVNSNSRECVWGF